MKSKKLLLAGLGGVLCLSFASFVYAQEESPNVSSTASDMDTVCESAGVILGQGGQISTDGETWLSQSDYEKNVPQVEWWTAEEYEKWILEEKKEMESLIGSNDGWYDGQGTFHKWTQENVDAIIAEYYQTLEDIKNGTLYSKEDGDGASYAMIPPSDDVECSYGVDVVRENGKSIHLGDYSTKEELNQAVKGAVESGKLTEQEAAAYQ
ncbi:MAG: hypothetical protein K2K56_15065 [Lachnospiraceae bacterium]|nr:hypothetical protein [Lachnospiraceae bacterium]